MKTVAILLLVIGLAAAGCGSGGKSPSVASLGDSATTTSNQNSTSPPGGFSTGRGGGGGGQFSMKLRGGVKYSKCMRAHGVHNFPDPDSTGAVSLNSRSGLDPNSPTFRAAQSACAKDLPNGGQPTPQQIAAMKQGALAFSACMRAHGIKDFPDPDFTGNGIRMRMRGGPGSDLDKNNPKLQRAMSTCQHLLPKGPGGGKK